MEEKVDEQVRMLVGLQEATVRDDDGREVEVTIIRPGLSRNGLLYTGEMLMDSLPLWEGCTALSDHVREGERASVRNVVGSYSSIRYKDGVRGMLRFLAMADDLWRMVRQVVTDREVGKSVPQIGISADMYVEREPATYGGKRIHQVTKIVKVNSADVVFDPSAGGSFDRIVESVNPELLKKGDEREMEGKEKVQDNGSTANILEAYSRLETKEKQLECEALLSRTLTQAALLGELPVLALKRIEEQFGGRVFGEGELPRAMAREKEYVGAIAAAQKVTGLAPRKPEVGFLIKEWSGGRPKSVIRIGMTPEDRIRRAWEQLFEIESDEPKVRPFSGIREAYVVTTGDYEISGHFRAQEATMVASDVPELLSDTLYKKLQQEYNQYPQDWREWCSVRPLKSLEAQISVQLDGLASMPSVAEGASYTQISATDFSASYTPKKYGATIVITREMILRDDTQGLTRLPGKLAQACGLTLNQTIYGLVENNSTIYDGSALFLSTSVRGANGGNLISGALASGTLADALMKLRSARDKANDGSPIIFRKAWLVVPPALELTAARLCGSEYAVQGGSREVPEGGYNFFRQKGLDYTVAPWYSSASKYFVAMDPRDCSGMEIGFVNGQDTPQLFIQDDPRVGSVFTNDQISYKVRFEFGAAIVNWRAFVGYNT